MKNAGPPIRYSLFAIRYSRSAMTLVELLVVMVIISILIGSVMVVTTTLIERGRINNTKAVLHNVSDALEAFRREQESRPTVVKRSAYKKRYGLYPPDELEVFTESGVRGDPNPRTLAPGDATVVPVPASGGAYAPMRFWRSGNPAMDALEHRDLLAMIIAIETLSEEAATILRRIPDRFRTAGVLDSKGDTAVFLDRDDDGDWGEGDLQIRPIVDAWGQPLGYMSQRDWEPGSASNMESSNFRTWNELSTKIVQLQGGKPLIFSYGPDGEQQLTREAMSTNDALASLPGDYAADDDPDGIGDVDHHLNADNVYLDPTLADRLAKGLD